MSNRIKAVVLVVLAFVAVMGPIRTYSQQPQAQSEELVRRAKTRVQPAYPEMAKKFNIAGTVKIEVVVSPNGAVKEARVVGGHPVLAGAALDAAKKWRFEPAGGESTGIIDFKFEPR